MNNRDKITNIIFCKKMLKYGNILDLFKLCFDYYTNNILDIDNKNYIKSNLLQIFINNFNHKHLDYVYNLSKKYLFNLNTNLKPIKKYITFFNEYIKFLIEINQKENLFLENNIFYVDKYFIFDSSHQKSGLKTSPVNIKNNIDLGLSLFFSFYSIKSNTFNNNEQIILSLNNDENKSYIFRIILIKNSLYIYTKNEKKILIMENIKFNCFYLCFFYYDQTMIYFFINNDYKFFDEKNILKNVNKIYVEIGYSKERIGHFNGIMGPVILFNSIIKNQFDIFLYIKNILKGNYYLIGEIFNEEKINNNESNIIYFSFEEYKGLLNIDVNELNKIKYNLGNIIYYINPEIFLNNVNFIEQNKFRDYQIYKSPFNESNNNIKIQTIYYKFITDQKLNNLIFKENNILKFFINNQGFNLIILIIETMYNFLLIKKNGNSLEYIQIM